MNRFVQIYIKQLNIHQFICLVVSICANAAFYIFL